MSKDSFPFEVSEPKPKVGIFWTYEGRLFYEEGTSFDEGVKTTISIDYKVGHYAAWFFMKQKGILKDLPLKLQSEYDLIPRGRVVYLFRKKKFVVYHGFDFSPLLYQRIKECFYLPKDHTIEDIDMHYNPLPDDFEF